jgi:hypothetical protein
MRIQDLPFLHYMVRVGSGRGSHLVSPMEAETTASGGVFVAPLQSDGGFFAAYHFHFSIYLGEGEFVKQRTKKAIFSGVAAGMQLKGREHVLLTFEFPGPEPWFWYDLSPRLPRVLKYEDEVFLPLFRKVPRRGPLNYAGRFRHKDFACKFVELEPTEPQILDDILFRLHISLIGCDPHTAYERRAPEEP